MNEFLLFCLLFDFAFRLVGALQHRDSAFLQARWTHDTLVQMQSSDFAQHVFPQLANIRCINTTSPFNLWLVYHDAQSGEVAESFAQSMNGQNNFMIRAIDNSAGDLPGPHERTSDVVPVLGEYGHIVNENGVIIALGFGLQACEQKPQWVGTASWKAVQENEEREKCRTLPHLLQPNLQSGKTMGFIDYAMNTTQDSTNAVEAAMREVIAVASHSRDATNQTDNPTMFVTGDATNETVFYWYGIGPRKLSRPTKELASDGKLSETFSKKHVMLKRFFREVLDVDVSSLFKLAVSDSGLGLPWKNWFVTTPEVMVTLAKLHTLLYSWIDTRYPLKQVGCSPDVFDVPGSSFFFVTGEEQHSKRCWGYIGEYLSILYFTSATQLLQTGCSKILPFRANHSHDLTLRINDAWNVLAS